MEESRDKWQEISQGDYRRLKRKDPKNVNSYTARVGHKFYKSNYAGKICDLCCGFICKYEMDLNSTGAIRLHDCLICEECAKQIAHTIINNG